MAPIDPRTAAALDWGKALAILAVFVTHAGPFAHAPADPVDQWLTRTVTAFNVPVFLAISGYLHATATPNTLAQLGARLGRVLVPYLLASLVLTAFGLAPGATWAALPTNLALGNVAGIYYYVFVWCGCVLTSHVWSRLGTQALLVALAGVTLATWWRMGLPPSYDAVWDLRDPLLQGWTLCYLGGWCARRFDWPAVVRRYPVGAIALASAGAVPWLAMRSTGVDARLCYTASVLTVLVTVATRPAPAPVRWLSRETLLLYLWHMPVIEALVRYAIAWPPVVRIGFATSGTLAVCVVGVTLWRSAQRVTVRRA